jgi:acetyltransferase
MEFALKNGTRVLVRPIEPTDKAELEAGLHRLSDATVHKRFLAPKPRFTAAELRYLTEVDGHDHVALVAEEVEHPDVIVAVGRWVRWPDDPEAAEAAIVVADPLQGKGLGSLLADLLAHEAICHDVHRFTATLLGENVAAHRLMGRLTGHLERRGIAGGASELAVELDGAALRAPAAAALPQAA